MKKTLWSLGLAAFALALLAAAPVAPADEPIQTTQPAVQTADTPTVEAPAAEPADSAELLALPAFTPAPETAAAEPELGDLGRLSCWPPECGSGLPPCPGGRRCQAKCCF